MGARAWLELAAVTWHGGTCRSGQAGPPNFWWCGHRSQPAIRSSDPEIEDEANPQPSSSTAHPHLPATTSAIHGPLFFLNIERRCCCCCCCRSPSLIASSLIHALTSLALVLAPAPPVVETLREPGGVDTLCAAVLVVLLHHVARHGSSQGCPRLCRLCQRLAYPYAMPPTCAVLRLLSRSIAHTR